MRLNVIVNGTPREADGVWEGESLLSALRDHLDLPGSKNACEQGECGSCSVYLDGELVCSCLVLAAQAEGREVVTAEGIAPGEGELHEVQRACSRRPARAGRATCATSTRRSPRPMTGSWRPRSPRAGATATRTSTSPAAWHDTRRIVLEAFGDHYSPSLQFTLHRMGEAVLEARPEVERIRFSLPNKHHLLYDLSRFGLENDHEIFHATDEPYGLIEGTVERASAEIRAGENGGSAVSAPVRP